MTIAAISLENVERRLGTFAFGPLRLDVPQGAICALVGPNGAGKTTLLDLLMGMGRADGGSIRVLGLDPDRDEVETKRRTAYVTPDLGYQPWGRVGAAIDFVRGFYPDWDSGRCTRLLAAFGLSRDEKIAALSFGARMKLALVMALSRDPDLLLLDEPTVGLDAQARRTLFTELLAFMERDGRTIVISSHSLADLERFADHVAILDRGRLVTEGRMDSLVERYCQVDARVRGALPAIDGARVMGRDGDRVRLLLDLRTTDLDALGGLGVDIEAQAPVTLEELLLALTDRVAEREAV